MNFPNGRRRTRGIAVLAAAALFLAGAQTAPAAEQRATVGDLGAALAKAIKGKDLNGVRTAGDALAESGEAAGAEMLVEIGLLSDSPAIEELVLESLRLVSPGPAFDRLCDLCHTHKRKEVRYHLTQILGLCRDQRANEAVFENLYDSEDGVIIGVLETVKLKDDIVAVGPLIKALFYQEEQKRANTDVAHEIRRTLLALTGCDFPDSKTWQEFWDLKGPNYQRPSRVERKKGPKKAEEAAPRTGVVKIEKKYPTFFGIELLSQQIVFVLDCSISMKAKDPLPPGFTEDGPVTAGGESGGDPTGGRTGLGPEKKKGEGEGSGGSGGAGGGGDPGGEKPDVNEKLPESRMRLRRVQKELLRLIQVMPEDTEFTVIAYNNKVLHLSSTLLLATPENKSKASAFVQQFSPDAETWTDDALKEAFKVKDARTIFLLSDGAPVRNEVVIDVPTILNWVDVANRFRRMEIHTIGFRGTEQEIGGFLKELARRNRGKYTALY
ncbi:MAG: hypothetical protein L0Z55_08200 [Planctomycetes bacterium]|nr:hypothetical protein [Planctomycetota bacterium]